MITIISDIDGVLIDSKNSIFLAYKRAFELQNYHFEFSDFEKLLWNQSWDFQRIINHYPNIDSVKLRKDKQHIFKTLLLNYNSDLITLLNSFNKLEEINLILITGGSEEATQYKLIKMNLSYNKLICSAKKHDISFWLELKHSILDSIIWLIDDDDSVCNLAKKVGINALYFN